MNTPLTDLFLGAIPNCKAVLETFPYLQNHKFKKPCKGFPT